MAFSQQGLTAPAHQGLEQSGLRVQLVLPCTPATGLGKPVRPQWALGKRQEDQNLLETVLAYRALPLEALLCFFDHNFSASKVVPLFVKEDKLSYGVHRRSWVVGGRERRKEVCSQTSEHAWQCVCLS